MLLVIVLVLATGASTFVALRLFLTHQLDDQLESVAQQDSIVTLLNPHANNNMSGSFQAPTTVNVAVLTNDGDYTGYQPTRGAEIQSLGLGSGLRKELAGQNRGPITAVTTNGSQVRLMSVPGGTLTTVSTQGQIQRQRVTVVVALSEDDLNKTLGRLLTAEILIGVGAVVVALLATTAGVRFSLRRLRRVTTTAQEVAAEL